MAGNAVNGSIRRNGSSISPSVRISPSIELSPSSPALMVAEIGLNHCGELNRAKELIHAASEAGADAVKFQKRSPRDLLTESAYERPYHNGGNSFGPTYGKHREVLELTIEQYSLLSEFAQRYGLLLFVSAWDYPSLCLVRELNMPIIKIPSADLTNDQLLIEASELGKPLFVSTGMSREGEINHAVSLLKKLATPFVLFHTVSLYPTPPKEARLSTISHFQSCYGELVGYSGHELEPALAVAARSLGACVIEKHFTLDRTWKGPDQAVSLTPAEFSRIVQDVRLVEQALANIRYDLVEGEERQRRKLAKSVVAGRHINQGEIITSEMLTFKCPGEGISPQHVDRILGRRAATDIARDTLISEDQLDGRSRSGHSLSGHFSSSSLS